MSDLFTDMLYLALYVLGDALNVLAGGLIFLAIVNGIISIVQPMRR